MEEEGGRNREMNEERTRGGRKIQEGGRITQVFFHMARG
jgi:hypothetical protein